MSKVETESQPMKIPSRRGGLIRNLHVWLALIATIPWALQGLTGAILVFEPELDHWLNRGMMDVEPTSEADRLDLDEQFDVVNQQHPELAPYVYGIDASDRPGIATRMLAKPEGEVGPEDGVRLFIDPYRGEVTGTQGYRDSTMGKLYHFHRTFYLPRWGRWITSTSALLLMAGALTGVILYFLKRKPTDTYRKWHARLGMAFAPLVFLIALNGVVVTYRFVVFPLLYVATGDEIPRGMIRPPKIEVPDNPARIGLEESIRIAEQAVPDARTTVILQPLRSDSTRTVMRKKPNEPRDVGGTFVTLNPYSGEVLDITCFTEGAVGGQLVYATEHLHKGEWGGYFGEEYMIYTRVLWFVAAMSIPVLAVLGWGSYFRARRRRGGETASETAGAVS